MLWRRVYGLLLCPLHPNNVSTHFCQGDLCINKEMCRQAETLRFAYVARIFFRGNVSLN
jgi:hypothetical protein